MHISRRSDCERKIKVRRTSDAKGKAGFRLVCLRKHMHTGSSEGHPVTRMIRVLQAAPPDSVPWATRKWAEQLTISC